MNTIAMRSRVLGGIICGLVSTIPCTQAAPRLGRAEVIGVVGTAEYQVQGRDWKNLYRGATLTEGASSRTATNSLADMALSTDAQLRITQNTIIRFDQLRTDAEGLPQVGKRPHALTSVELERGKVLVRAAAPTEKSSFAVTTRSCLSEVRGFGAYSVYLLNNRACVRVMDQTVTVLIRGRADPVVLQAGQQLCVECDPRTNQARDPYAQPTTPPEPDPDWNPPLNPPPGAPPGKPVEPPPVYELSPTQPK